MKAQMPTTRKKLLASPTEKLQKLPDDKGYEAFLRGLELVSLGMKDCSSKVQRWPLFRALRGNARPNRKFDERYRLSSFEPDHFDCEGDFTLTVVGEGERLLLEVEVTFEAHLHGKKPVNKIFAEQFAQSDFRLIVLPYARYFISDITAQMSVPPIVIPLIATQNSHIPGHNEN